MDRKRSQPQELPWVEKYRPKTLDDVAHQEEVVSALRQTVSTGNLPHLLFYGPPGTGKTSTILAVARELYGTQLMKDRVLELNASNDRGIDIVRNKIKTYASLAIGSANVQGHPCPPYKIIILDEADSMTTDAQSALRRTMEIHTRVTRFVIICNYVSRIIEPISSRCAKFRFDSLPHDAMVGRLRQISLAEQLQLDTAVVDKLIELSEGDLRQAISLLQSAQRLSDGKRLDVSTVMEVATRLPMDVVEGALAACKTNSFNHIQQAAQGIVNQAYPVNQFLDQLLHVVTQDSDLSDIQKGHICVKLAEADHALIEGAEEWLQLLDVLAHTRTVIVSF